MWNPAQYAKFSDDRNRPFFELLARVQPEQEPNLIVDLGCGNGPLTLSLAQRWPQARIVGVDASPEMLAAARSLDTQGRVEWRSGDIATWCEDGLQELGARPDVIVTNAALQWVPTHRELIGGLARSCEWFAMQVPGNYETTSTTLIRDVLAALPGGPKILERIWQSHPVDSPTGYLRILGKALPQAHVETWETTYTQVLDPGGAVENPILEWQRGTALRPFLAQMTQAQQEAFLSTYAAALTAAFPREPWGVVFPFRRVFAVSHNRAAFTR